jgi:formamidopyrimidine-DNA glycosylase
MPEGPELYSISAFLNKKLKDSIFMNIESNTKSVVKLPKKSKIKKIYSYGKYCIIECYDYYVIIHLGLTGWFVFNKPKIYKYILEFNNQIIYLQDTRRFSSIKILNNNNELNDFIKNLGVDILSNDFTFDYFKSIMISKKKLLCNLLLDQSYFSGLGNYIKNEALYLTKLNINKKSNELTTTHIKELYHNILFITISNTITHLHNYNLYIPKSLTNLTKQKLEIPYHFNVYEQKVDKFNNKVILIKKHCGRNTFYVPSIQIE